MRVIKQPRKLHSEFLKNPQRFLRDFCGISGESDSPFIIFKDKLDKAFSLGGDNPFSDATLRFDDNWKPEDIEKPRFIHLDLSQNKCGTGLSSCYCPFLMDIQVREGDEIMNVKAPFVKFDFVGRIKAAPGEEVQVDDVEEIIYDLSYRGMKIVLITFDRFASLQMKQRLQTKGYTCTEMSIQRTANKVIRCFKDAAHPEGIRRETTNRQYLAGLNAFKEVLYEERLALPFHPIAKDEILKARIDRVKNIVEPLPNFTIDMLHSIAGSIYNLVNNTNFTSVDSDTNLKEFEDRYYSKHDIKRSTKTEGGPDEISFVDDYYELENEDLYMEGF